MYNGLGSRQRRGARQRTTYAASEFIPITSLAAIAAASAKLVCVRGLTVVSNDRPLAIAVVRKPGDPWIWLPRKVTSVGEDGGITMPRRVAEQKGLCPVPNAAA